MAQKQLNSHLEQIEVGLRYATRINAKWINNLNVKKKNETIKVLDNSTGEFIPL